MSDIKFIYFDIGNVLLLFSGGLKRLAEEYDIQYEDFETVFRKYDDKVCRGEINPQELWNTYKKELNINAGDLDFAEYWTDNFVLIQESFDLISSIDRSKAKLGIISNIYSGVFERLIKKNFFPINDWEAVILSCEVAFVKPEDEIYVLSEEKSNVKPNEILLIDDKFEFLAPAQKRGWQTFQFDPTNISNSVEKLRLLLFKKNVLT